MLQFLADQLDQLDLALDQLALKDRNFDRFALMLIDNVAELTLHQHAQDTSVDAQLFQPSDGPRYDPKLIVEALGPHFDAKLKLARTTNLLTEEVTESIRYLHGFRNEAYHQGARHEGILHSLALFYVRAVVNLLGRYEPGYWSSGGSDRIPHRAIKYLGQVNIWSAKQAFKLAWERLDAVAAHHGDTLVQDLYGDMEETIALVDEQIDFLAINSAPAGISRDQVVIDAQVWMFAFSEHGQAYAAKHDGPKPFTPGYIQWFETNYNVQFRRDPIPMWRERATTLSREKNSHLALKKYCEFVKQTETLRAAIDRAHTELHAHIQNQIDSARENPD